MHIGALIQARMSSVRCPGKVLHQVAGKPLLGHLLGRIAAVRELDSFAVATSAEPSDDRIAAYCEAQGVACFRGELENVAKRLLDAAEHLKLDAFVRVCGDSPMLDPDLLAAAVQLFRQQGPDLVTNCLPKRYPAGQSVEVVSLSTFRRVYAHFSHPGHFEHVTRYFYETPQGFRIACMQPKREHPGVNLAVDTPEDLEHMTRLIESLSGESPLSIDALCERSRALCQGPGRSEP